MNWADFERAEKALAGDQPPILMKAGVAFDNSAPERQTGEEFGNNYKSLFKDPEILGEEFEGNDFVWTGTNKVRVATLTGGGGGHPTLAGFDTVYCAGRIEKGYFFFHSGHYKPKQINAVYFFCNFIKNSCRSLAGRQRDRQVADLSQMTLRLYHLGSTGTYDTTFATLWETAPENKPRQEDMLGSTPIKTGADQAESHPSAIARAPVAFSSSRMLGISESGLFLKSVPARPPKWIPDSERNSCALCKKAFTMLTWKHHCRQCGDIFCDACSRHTKHVTLPAARDSNKERQPVRVCDTCYKLAQI
jgi:hypothetical protein